jgi:hypothetical protein
MKTPKLHIYHDWNTILEKDEYGLLQCKDCGVVLKWTWNHYTKDLDITLIRVCYPERVEIINHPIIQ